MMRVLLIVSGGVAAYKALELVRRGAERGLCFDCVLTAAAARFVTPLSFAALSGRKVHCDLFDADAETEMNHIRLSRDADLVVVAPATADLMAKAAHGLADDLASTSLLAADKPVLFAPAMNPVMWSHPATRRNLATLRERGARFVGPERGDMACGEVGAGRMAEPEAILEAIAARLAPKALAGRRALVTSGPTFEALDPVRFLGNRSSGKQGHAIAAALAEAGAETVLVTGPVAIADPPGVETARIESAREMAAACERIASERALDVAVCAAAVADWRPETVAARKIKKGESPPAPRFVENPDILATLSAPGPRRPRLVIGFAAETGDLERAARAKWARKGCDWLLANDVSPESETFGGDDNTVTVLRANAPSERWPRASKTEIARRLVEAIASELGSSIG